MYFVYLKKKRRNQSTNFPGDAEGGLCGVALKKGLNVMPQETPKTRYDARYVANRMSRAIGQVRLVRNMVESGADCTEVLIQLAAVRGQLDSISGKLMEQYAEQFAEEYRKSGSPELLEEFKEELRRAIRK